MPSPNAVSLREIAAKAGVCVASVSRAFRNDRKVSKAQAERIREIAAQMGYAMNPYLSSWMRNVRQRRRPQEREVIALVSFHEGIAKACWLAIIKNGAEQFASQCGYRVDTFLAADYASTSELFRVLRNRGIRGVILAPLQDAPFPEEAWQHSVVAISHPCDVKKIDVVDTDHYECMLLALTRLTQYGFKRIAYWSYTLKIETHKRWESAYHTYQQDLPPQRRLPVLTVDAKSGIPDYYEWVQKHRPEVILCSNDSVYFDLQREFSLVPHQVSWVSLNKGQDGKSPIAGIDIHLDMIGEAAARMVTRKMELNEVGPVAKPCSIFIRPEWSDGETLIRSRRRKTVEGFFDASSTNPPREL